MYADDAIADILVNRTHIFANIHPNIITLISLLCNIVLYILLARAFMSHCDLDVGVFTVILAVRCLTDILDGAVARKYHKTSQLGGLLDTLGDVTLMLLFAYFACVWCDVSPHICWIAGSLIAYVVYVLDIYHDHAAAKIYDGHIGRQALAFAVNNTVVLYGIAYAWVLYATSHAAPQFEGIVLW
jgi:phosphatidylglycerophosphate synthase